MGSLALARLNFQHSELSRLTSGGRSFLFRHYQTGSVNPIVWNVIYDALNGAVQNSVLSPAQQSLISTLLGVNPDANSRLQLFSEPAADAELLVTKEVNTDNGVDLVLEDVHLEVAYSFYNTTANVRMLTVEAEDGVTPRVTVSTPDNNGRQDGQNRFTRSFAPFSVVTMQVPARFGEFEFAGWQVDERPISSTNPEIRLVLSADAKLKPVFRRKTVSASTPLLTVQAAPSGPLILGFETITGRRYQLQGSLQLDSARWETLETYLGDGSPVQVTRSLNGESARYFRVRFEP